MKTFTMILKCIGILILSFIVIIIVNSGHDPLINAIVAGHAKDHIPSGQTAELISLAIVFVAGFLAAIVVSLLAGKQRVILLSILTVLFSAADLHAVLTDLAVTDLWYRILTVSTVPLQVWTGHQFVLRFLKGTFGDSFSSQ